MGVSWNKLFRDSSLSQVHVFSHLAIYMYIDLQEYLWMNKMDFLLEFGSNNITNFIINKGIYRLLYFGWKGITRGNISSFKDWLNAKLSRDPDTCIYFFFYLGGNFTLFCCYIIKKNSTFKKRGGVLFNWAFSLVLYLMIQKIRVQKVTWDKFCTWPNKNLCDVSQLEKGWSIHAHMQVLY